MTDVFDGLPDIFTETFGEAVDYTPVATGLTRRIDAIWIDSSGVAALGDGAAQDIARTELSVRAADVAAPREGDAVTRVRDGRTMTIATPILPDGKGLIVCALVD